MAYLPNYRWDLFISYAHKDERNFPPGWVSGFVGDLRMAIENGLSRPLEIFFDQAEQKAYNTIESILSEVRSSALLVVLATPSWIKSDWCGRELKEFLSTRADTTRVMVAELHPPEGELAFPPTLPDNMRKEFYTRAGPKAVPLLMERGEREYQICIQTLAEDIRCRLLSLAREDRPQVVRADAAAAPAVAAVPEGAHSVLIAACTADVADESDAVSDYLASQGIAVLRPAEPLPSSREQFETEFGAMLDRADVYIHLLGRKKGSASALGSSFTEVQLAMAEARGIETFLWLPDELDPHRIQDEEYRGILLRARNGSAVPELTRAVLEKLQEIQRAAEKPAPTLDAAGMRAPVVLVNADPEDFEFAAELVQACADNDCITLLDDCEINEIARQNWADADVIAFVQGNVSPRWLTSRIINVHRERAIANSGGALRGQAAIYAPPPPKRVGMVAGGRIVELDLSQEWDPARFAQWVKTTLCSQGPA
jgi:hypothetical protein